MQRLPAPPPLRKTLPKPSEIIPRPPAEVIPRPALPEEQKRVRPDVLLIALLDDLNVTLQTSQGLLARMEKTLSKMEQGMERIPHGVVETFDNIAVTGNSEQVFDTVEEVEQRWYSVTIYNKGADDVQVRVNDGLVTEPAQMRAARRSRYVTLAEGESVDVDFKAPLIERIYYKGASATASATIKIVGEW